MGSSERRLGMIVRCDQGGLGNQTWDIYRHLHPQEVLVMRLGDRGRGAEFPERYSDGSSTSWQYRGDVLDNMTMREFALACDKILTVETIYHPHGYDIAMECDTTTVLIANPELYAGYPADIIRVPTHWSLDKMPKGVRVLPHPVARDVLPFRERTECKTFYHPVAPAMLDRNGTDLLMRALPFVEEECRLVIRSHHRSPLGRIDKVGKVQVRWIHGHTDDYWDSYPQEADVMIMPRRYGGLCLPIQEAASLGMPAIMTALDPQLDWPFVTPVPVNDFKTARMKGGTFNVYSCLPSVLAEAMTQLVRHPELVKKASGLANEWADEHSWEMLLPQWRGLVG